MFVVIAYDVVCDRRRTRLAKLLSGFGERVNYSVFECELRQRQFDGLIRAVLKLIDPAEDRVRYYELGVDCRKRIQVNGQTVTYREEPLKFV